MFYWDIYEGFLDDEYSFLPSENIRYSSAKNYIWSSGDPLASEYNWKSLTESSTRFMGFYFTTEYGTLTPEEAQWWEIVAANFNVCLTDGSVIWKKNDSLVGALRTPGSEGGSSIEYGEGDYTNPMIDSNNVSFVNLMQQSHTYHPGSIKWRGHPLARPGTKVTVVDKNDNHIPFLVCSLELFYDGGMYMVMECHGSAETFDKNPGIHRELKKVRGMRALWKAKQAEEEK